MVVRVPNEIDIETLAVKVHTTIMLDNINRKGTAKAASYLSIPEETKELYRSIAKGVLEAVGINKIG